MVSIEINWLLVAALVVGYLFTFLSSTILVRIVINSVSGKERKTRKRNIIDTGFVVGICENFVIITFILANEILGLALVFTAKTIARHKEISREPEYYLVGTMVNFTYSLFMAMLIKYVISFI